VDCWCERGKLQRERSDMGLGPGASRPVFLIIFMRYSRNGGRFGCIIDIPAQSESPFSTSRNRDRDVLGKKILSLFSFINHFDFLGISILLCIRHNIYLDT